MRTLTPAEAVREKAWKKQNLRVKLFVTGCCRWIKASTDLKIDLTSSWAKFLSQINKCILPVTQKAPKLPLREKLLFLGKESLPAHPVLTVFQLSIIVWWQTELDGPLVWTCCILLPTYLPSDHHINVIKRTNPKRWIPHGGKKASTALVSAEAVTVLYGMSLGAMCGRGAQSASSSSSQLPSERGSTRSTHEGQSCSHSVPAMSTLQLIMRLNILRSIRNLFRRDIYFRIAKVSAASSKTDEVNSIEIIQQTNKQTRPTKKTWSQRIQHW